MPLGELACIRAESRGRERYQVGALSSGLDVNLGELIGLGSWERGRPLGLPRWSLGAPEGGNQCGQGHQVLVGEASEEALQLRPPCRRRGSPTQLGSFLLCGKEGSQG